LLAGDQGLTVTLSQANDHATRKILVSKLVKFTYTPEIYLRTFFLFAVVGVVIGYWVRLIVRILAAIAPPSADAAEGAPKTGPITNLSRGITIPWTS
jgi:hypothetical protein